MNSDILEALEKITSKIAKRNGYSDNYKLIISEDGELANNIDVVITSGTTPCIKVNNSFILDCFLYKKANRLRDRLDRALNVLPKVTWSLQRLNPPGTIVLLSDLKKWQQIELPKKENVSWYSITVMDEISGCKVTLTSDKVDDLVNLKVRALMRLEHLIEKPDTSSTQVSADTKYDKIIISHSEKSDEDDVNINRVIEDDTRTKFI